MRQLWSPRRPAGALGLRAKGLTVAPVVPVVQGGAAPARDSSATRGVLGHNGTVPAQEQRRSSSAKTNQMNRSRTTSESGGSPVMPELSAVARQGSSHSGASIFAGAKTTVKARARQLTQ